MIAPVMTTANVDIEQKTDYVLTDKREEQGKFYGIQFCSSTDPEILASKRERIDRARDLLRNPPKLGVPLESLTLVAVDMPDADTIQCYQNWKQRRAYLAGGPEQLLSMEIRKQIILQSLTPVVGHEEALRQGELLRP